MTRVSNTTAHRVAAITVEKVTDTNFCIYEIQATTTEGHIVEMSLFTNDHNMKIEWLPVRKL